MTADDQDPANASYLRLLLLGIAAFVGAAAVIAAIIAGVIALVR